MAHTPGPWEASCEEYGEDGEWSIDTKKRQIARTNPYHLPSGEAKANAHLIAAAPELLEALKRLDGYMEILGIGYGPIRAAAREAIAKAEGR